MTVEPWPDDDEPGAVSAEEEKAWLRLKSAIEKRGEPDCGGIELFTAEHLTAGDIEVLAPICGACSVLALCRTYADVSAPVLGYWAGKAYGSSRPRGRGARHLGSAEWSPS